MQVVLKFHSYISLSLVSEDPFGYIPGVGNHSHATKELSISRCARSNKQLHQICWFIGSLKGDTNLTKEGSFSTTFCSNSKHSLNCMYHVHKRNATEVTKIWLK